jgi:hypothetical protein
VRSCLPADTRMVTSAERDTILRDRTVGAQLRTFW